MKRRRLNFNEETTSEENKTKEISPQSRNISTWPMGVKTLWSVIGGAGEPTDLRSLQGKCVAIDLAGWAVQGGKCAGMYRNGVTRPHLRNLFFRTAALLALNIRPVFVLDGEAPELKRTEMKNRRKAELDAKNPSQSHEIQDSDISLNRSRLKGIMKECANFLNVLGVSWVQAVGEAEFAAAILNAERKVDAVITDDSDAFCYGATWVLRNFTISGSNASGGTASVESYLIDKMSSTLNLDRRRLIFMALLLGCDFCPTGVPGLGKEIVRQLLALWPISWDPIRILKLWIIQNFEETVTTSTGKKSADVKKRGGKQSKSYFCQQCVDSSSESDKGKNHCSDCTEWKKNVFSFSNDSKDHCHCTFLINDTVDNAFEGESKNMFKLENIVKRKCRAMQDIEGKHMYDNFWENEFPRIVDEFENSANGKIVPKSKSLKSFKLQQKTVGVLNLNDNHLPDKQKFPPPIAMPNVLSFVFLATQKLCWTEEYAVEKILPVICRAHLSIVIDGLGCNATVNKDIQSPDFIFEPVCLTKRRVAASNPSYNVEWKILSMFKEKNLHNDMMPDTYESCEPECLLIKAYPALVEKFLEVESSKKQKKIRKPKVTKKNSKVDSVQKPITEFFSQGKNEQKVDTFLTKTNFNIIPKPEKEIIPNTNCEPLPETKNDNKTHILKTMENILVTPAIKKTKRDLFRRVFEESPDLAIYSTFDTKQGLKECKENIPLQSTPLQVRYKLV